MGLVGICCVYSAEQDQLPRALSVSKQKRKEHRLTDLFVSRTVQAKERKKKYSIAWVQKYTQQHFSNPNP